MVKGNTAITVNLKLLAAQIMGMFFIFGLALFLGAGTAVWLAGWTFLVLFFSFTVAISLWLFKRDPGLLVERMTGVGKPGQPTWDKVWYFVTQIIFLAWLVLMPLDAVRFRWSQMPVWLQAAGAIILLTSFYIFFLIFRENAYLSPAVRIQTERNQKVITTGPYRYVRHPMYSTAVIFLIGTALLLGSWCGLLMNLVLIVIIACRAIQEEHTLKAELSGYEAYMTHVKYRFIPYVW
jgi:protein-S-isoprenylcysteine O-methyltransferase Ste14